MKHLRLYSKRILMLCSFALLIQSTSMQALPAWMEQAKKAASNITKKVGSAFDFISEKTKQTLDTATKKALSFDKAKLFNTVQNKMTSAGDRVRKIANCIATGRECNVADRVILVATASFIFVSLMVLAGSSIGVAARAKIAEEAKKDQAQQVKGWGPKQMAQRLSNVFSDGKNKFVSLKNGIIKGQLTTSQRNFMISLGASILGATLILAAVLTGLAVYSAQQETKQKTEIEKQQELADRQAETATPDTNSSQTSPPTAPTPPEAKPKGTFNFLGDLKDLAKEISTQIEEKITPMQAYFKKDVIVEGANAMQAKAKEIQKLLQEKTTAAKRAIISTVVESKQKLADFAQNKFNQAKQVAQEFMQEIKAGGEQFYQGALEKILGVKVKYIQPSIDSIKKYSVKVGKAFTPFRNLKIMGEIQRLTNDVNDLVAKASNIGGKWKEALTELTSRATWIKTHIRPEWMGGKSTAEINKEADQKYPLAKSADDLYNFYPKFVESINKLSLSGPGLLAQNALKTTAALLMAMKGLNKVTGKIGKILISRQLSEDLGSLQEQLITLGNNIRKISTIKPLLKVFPASTPGALFEALKGFAWRVGTDLHTQIMNPIKQIKALYEDVIVPYNKRLTQKRDDLAIKAKGIPAAIRKQLMARMQTDPIKTTVTAPYLLALMLGKSVSEIKADITALANDANILLQGIIKIITLTLPMFLTINQAAGGEFINPTILEGLKEIKENIKGIEINFKKINSGIQESIPTIPG